MKDLELIARQVLQDEITEEEAANELIVELYHNRRWLRKNKLSEDGIQDFLLIAREHLGRIFSTYNPKLGTFCNFFYSSMQLLLHAYRKQKASDIAAEESLALVGTVSMEEDIYKYHHEEPELLCETTFEKEAALKEELYALRRDSSAAFDINHCVARGDRSASFDERKENLRKAACLIFALKSSLYLDSEIIRKVSLVTGVGERRLQNMTEQVKASLTHKLKRRDICRKCRDNAFFYHRKYLVEALKLDSNCNLAAQKLEKYAKQTKVWKEKIAQLNTPNYMPVPTNETIGRILNIPARRIGYIIKMARRHIDTIAFKHYDGENENIPSDGKS